jgi:uncharacterized protein YukJ
MALTYGFLKAKVSGKITLVPSRRPSETQYHLHVPFTFEGAATAWDVAINVGTNDSDDLLQYKIATDFAHPILATLRAAAVGFKNLTGTAALPALDFLRSDILTGTGPWRESGVMDGSDLVEPTQTLQRLLERAQTSAADVYVFGREYAEGNGVHDVHMNQGSQGAHFRNNGNDQNDHNDIWQDGAAIIDFGQGDVSAYFTAFSQQLVPTDQAGNPTAGATPIG